MQRRFSRPRFGGPSRGFGMNLEKPVKMDETYDVEIKEMGSKGDGIARIKNFIIFVPDTKKGEKCKIRITQVKSRFAVGEKVAQNELTEEGGESGKDQGTQVGNE